MKLAILAAIIVVASAYESLHNRERRQVLLPGAYGYGVGYGAYPGVGLGYGAGLYGAGLYGAGFYGRKRRAVEETSAEDVETDSKDKRQILLPGAYGYGVGYGAYPVGLGYGAGLYGAGLYGAGFYGRKRRAVEDASVEAEAETEDKDKRQVLLPGAYGYGVGYGAYPVGLGYGAGLYGAGLYGAGFYGRRRRDVEAEEHKDKRQVLLPGAYGYGVRGFGYPGVYGGVYPGGFYGARFPSVILRKREAERRRRAAEAEEAESSERKDKRWVYGPGYGLGYGGLGYPAYGIGGYPVGYGLGLGVAPAVIL